MADELAVGKEIQQLWGAALNRQSADWLAGRNLDEPTRPRPWTREEVHCFLMARYGINSMKLVKAKDVIDLLVIFGGPAIVTPSSEISDEMLPF